MRCEGKKNGETRHKKEKTWGEVTQDKKNGEMRHEAKKMGRRNRRLKKKWGDETRDEKKMRRDR